MTPKVKFAGLLTVVLVVGCALPDHGGTDVTANQESLHLDTSVLGAQGGSRTANTHSGGAIGTTGGSRYVDSKVTTGGNLATGGNCAGGVSSACDCDSGGTSSKVNDEPHPTPQCAGLCELSSDHPASGTILLQSQMLFGYQFKKIPPSSNVVSLGAVTALLESMGARGQFQLGLYSDSNGAPAELLAMTNVLTANDPDTPIEGELQTPYTTASDLPAPYWVVAYVVSNSSNVFLEELDTAQPEALMFTLGQSCLPLSTPDCVMPTLYTYGSPYITLKLGSLIPYLYAKYVVGP